MRYVLDTNVLLYYVRGGTTRTFLVETYDVFGAGNEPYISIVTVAEILVLAEKYGWGPAKTTILQELLSNLNIIDIEFQDLVEHYVHIELFSLNLHPDKPRAGSAMKMGKNDLWIAATAALIDATLLTSDKDFNHLDGEILQIETYSRQ